MNKKTVVSMMASSLLLAPFVLNQVVAADENLPESAPTKEVVTQVAPEPVASEGAASQSQADQAASAPSVEPKKEVETSEPAGPSPIVPAETEKADKPVEQEKTMTVTEKTNLPQAPQGVGVPASPAASMGTSTPATGQALTSYTGSLANSELKDKELTVQNAVDELLQWAATDSKQVGQSAADRERFAKSLGLIEKSEDLTRKVSQPELAKMYETAKKLYDAYRAEKKSPLFLNGRAQPIFPYTTGEKADEDYKYEDSQIVRFPVYVETDYDTDADGKPDLVKAIVQLPKAVAQGDFKAATILEARPYVAGTLDENYVTLESLGLPTDGSYDMKKLHNQPAKRQPVSSETTEEAAKKAKASDWYYYSPYEYIYDYEDLNWYDYFLVRGYAFISSAGLGTKGSEGFNTTGSDLEINAFKNIIEWVNGKRKAYTDKTSNVEIKADWATGNVAMTGLS
ncbi:CocE/NonD family hydrolase, partial [Streptococcus sp.]